MTQREPLATFDFSSKDPAAGVDAVLAFVKRTRDELRELRMVRVWEHRLEIVDVNQDFFEVREVGYIDAEIVPLLDSINTNYSRKTIHDPPPAEFKEFKTGRRYTWANDRVM